MLGVANVRNATAALSFFIQRLTAAKIRENIPISDSTMIRHPSIIRLFRCWHLFINQR